MATLSKMPQTEFLQAKEERIRERIKRTARDVWEIGKDLLEVKEALPHGQFGNWIQEKFGWGHQTANNFMNVAKNFPEIPNNWEISHRALYLLAAPKTPESARKDAVKAAENNSGKLTEEQAKGVVAVHASVAAEPSSDERIYLYNGKRAWGRLGEGQEDFGWLEPGTPVRIKSSSLTDRTQAFVCLQDEPNSVIQVSRVDLVLQYDLFEEEKQNSSIQVGDVVCFYCDFEDIVAELDDGVLILSGYLDLGKVLEVKEDSARLIWTKGQNREEMDLHILRKLPEQHQDAWLAPNPKFDVSVTTEVEVEVLDTSEEADLVYSARRVLGDKMFEACGYTWPENGDILIEMNNEVQKSLSRNFIESFDLGKIHQAIIVVNLLDIPPLLQSLIDRAASLCFLKESPDQKRIALFFHKPQQTKRKKKIRLTDGFEVEFSFWGEVFVKEAK